MDTNFLFRISFEALTAHKLRTFLTMLGVIIGVAAVVAMLSIGEGAKQEALEQISILGINNVIVNAQVPSQSENGADVAQQRSPGLSLADGENIARFDDLVKNVVPQRFEPILTVSYRSHEAPVRVVATTPNFMLSSSIEVEYGRFITPLDIDDFSQVCVLGAKAKRALFAFDDPIGRSIRISDLDFTVIGVMMDKYIARGKVEGLELKNFNEDIYIPLTTAQKMLPREAQSESSAGIYIIRHSDDDGGRAYNIPEVDQLTITVTDLKFVPAVASLVERIIERRHAGVKDYEIVVPESLLRQSQKTQQIFNVVMGAIAGLSLLVGGIGIMNIMLASVLERTREIGIRRAAGAKRHDILSQFLVEAVTICLIGCAIGILTGLAISRAISYFAGWPTIVSVFSIALAVIVSTAVGVIFGMFPAYQAAKLDVIESLRYE